MKKENYGGQALIEGVMMRGPKSYAIAVRNPDGGITVEKTEGIPWMKANFFFGLPLIRGIINLAEMLSIGISTLMRSAEISLGEEKPSRIETWFSVSLALVIGIGLFIALPAFIFSKAKAGIGNILLLNTVEGLVRIGIFIAYILIVSIMPDMKRVFEYHGAEHKVIHTYEQIDDFSPDKLTIDTVQDKTTLHPSCGTSFIFIVLIVSIFIFAFLGRPTFLQRIALKLSLMPAIIGVSYEIIRAARRKNAPKILGLLVLPGVLFQKITTRQPSDDQIEVAIESFKAAYEGDK
ncbi:DUF1385 domain-containing protein [Candidatus Margulisiibacteriota bacterium]